MSVVANVAINVDAANAIQQLDRIKAAAGQSEKGLKDASGAAAGFGASLTAALGPIIGVTSALAALGKSLTVFQGRETDVAVLKNGLKGLVTDVDASAAALVKLGDEFGKTTLFSEEDFTRGAQLLTSFRGIAVSNYEEVINTAGDVAQVMKTDVNGSLLQLAKALQDPVLGLSALSRSGIQFNETQKETIKSMVAVGNVADAQKLILRELQVQYGGAAAAAGKTGLAAALDTLAEVANDVFNAIGKIFSPLATQAATRFTSALQEVEAAMPQVQAAVMALMTPLGAIADVVLPAVSGAFKFVLQNIQAIIQVATFFGTFVGVLNAITLATKAWAAATTVLGTAQKVAAVAAAALQAMSGPAGIRNVIAATVTATGASLALGKAMDSAAKKITSVKGETDLTAQSAREMLKNYSLTPPAIASAEGKAKDLKAAQKAISDEIKHQNDLIKGQLNIESQRISQSASLVQARSQAEIAVNQVILDRLNAELQSATTAQDRVRLAQEIYNVEIANAKATYAATVAQIEAQTQLADLAAKEQQIKLIQLQVEQALLTAKGAQTKELERAIQLQNQAIQLASENAGYTKAIAAEQLRGADATYQAAVQAAALKRETNGAAQAAAAFASNMTQAVNSVSTITGMPGERTTSKQARATDPLKQAKLFEQKLKEYEEKTAYGIAAEKPDIEDYMPGGRYGGYIPGGSSLEERERTTQLEKDIAAALAIALDKYNAEQAQKSGENVNLEVNIQTGPVTQMDGTNYVTQRDLMNATESAARQSVDMALKSLKSSPALRRSTGLAR